MNTLNFYKLKKVCLLVTISMLVLGAAPLWAQKLAPLVDTTIPLNPKILHGTLPNGLQYFILKNKKPENKVQLRLLVNTGSILENDNQQGLAHFLEHMEFNGTKNFPKNSLVNYLQSAGVAFGADLNAYTSFDETVYMLPIASDDLGKLDSAFQVLADWSGNASLEPKQIDEERGVVLEESRLGKGADERMMHKWLPALFNGSKYGRRLPIGLDTILKTFKYPTLTQFYKNWYRPNLQAVCVVGDIDSVQVEKMIKAKFSGFKNLPNSPVRPLYVDVPARTSSNVMILNDNEADNTQVIITGSSRLRINDKSVRQYRDDLVEMLFSEMLNQRLGEYKSKANPPFIFSSYSYGAIWARYYKNYLAFSACGEKNVADAVQTIFKETKRAKLFGFTPGELERAKSSVLNRLENQYNEKDKTESGQLVTELTNYYLKNEPMPGIEWEYNYAKQQLPFIAIGEVNQVAKQNDIDKNYFVVVTSKTSPTLITKDSLQAVITKTLSEDVTPYVDKAVASSLLTKTPTAGKIHHVETNDKLKTITYHLYNGAVVTLLLTTYKNDEIVMNAYRKGGFSLYSAKDYQSGEYSNNVVDEMGYGNFSKDDLKKFLTGKKASVTYVVDKYNEMIQGSTNKKDLETFFQVLYLKATGARKDQTGFDSYVSSEKQGVELVYQNPQNVFFDSTQMVLYNNNPRAHAFPKKESFDKINADNALAFYNSRFNTGYGMNYFFVGNIDTAVMRPFIETYIASLPATMVDTMYGTLNLKPTKGQNNFTLKKGKEPKSLILDYFYKDVTYNADDKLPLDLLNAFMNNKIIDTIREKMSAIYGGGIGGSVSKIPQTQFMASTYLPCGPENVQKVTAALNDILQKATVPGYITDADFNKAKQTALQRYKTQIQSNNYWLMVLGQSWLNGDNPERVLTFEDRLNKVTIQNLIDMANKYYKGSNSLHAVLLPE